MFGPTGILVALLALTIALAAVFLVRPSITVGAMAKILAFVLIAFVGASLIGLGILVYLVSLVFAVSLPIENRG